MLNKAILYYLQQDQFVGELAESSHTVKVYLGRPEADCFVLSLQHDSNHVTAIRFLAQGSPVLIASCAYVSEQLHEGALELLNTLDSKQLVAYFSLDNKDISKAVLVENALKQLYRQLAL
ncbi:hypothetical protein AVI51_00285 [Piscirickettsia salmonis]|uniref:Uncharacterized protein n=1 Tax=Piscirickettsia salmonis TaxID=1238 RepID=A0A9Q5YKI4_PISSA|nr:hypothetical protein [Piscirickettsia salmonis]ALA24484.1 nitrogen-fixing protein NifU [Piscirickettsia salmonis]APS44840.1 hypothetical protein AVI48_11015 [Piscirickettsia salmonis]APS48201.1 hypothetical protein AVI49_11620 [Piscirickettsia salmonis]APS49470.1 hypothetical protein AVI50_00310 [Piscirickettsia salmonis]APS52646.1 hypothetical protein AVI51_00285 [Piscirickettsia salmonis]